jgi:hypothetical protein
VGLGHIGETLGDVGRTQELQRHTVDRDLAGKGGLQPE